MKPLWIIALHTEKSNLEAPDFSSDLEDIIPPEYQVKGQIWKVFYIDFL